MRKYIEKVHFSKFKSPNEGFFGILKQVKGKLRRDFQPLRAKRDIWTKRSELAGQSYFLGPESRI